MHRHGYFRSLFAGAMVGLAICCVPNPTVFAADLAPQATERVAATVNNEAITIHDLDARVRLGLLAANIPDTAENRGRLAREVLRRLIDERLELQEADKLKIEVTDTEVNGAVSDLEKQNHMAKGGLIELLKDNEIDPDTLRDQLRAQIVWSRVVRSQLLPTVHIGEEEITARLNAMKDGLSSEAYLAADIFLPVEDPRREADVRELADRLVEQLKAGAPFGSLARQFSQFGAATGGDLGWVTKGMVDSVIADALSQLEVGHASVPLRTRDGYHIILLRDKHAAGEKLANEPTLDIAQVDLTVLPSATEQERQDLIARFKREVVKDDNCEDYERHARNIAAARYSHPGLMRPSETPSDVRPLIANLQKGELSAPFKIENIERFFIACSRTDAVSGLPSRDEVKRRLENERLELLAQRYLRDLRRAAFVEIRI